LDVDNAAFNVLLMKCYDFQIKADF